MSNCGSCVHFLAYEFTDRDKEAKPDDRCINPRFLNVVSVEPMASCGYHEPNNAWNVMALCLLAEENGISWN